MDHIPDIRFINTHSKSNSGNNYLYFFIQKLVLPPGPQFLVEPCMIGNCFNLIGYQYFCQLLGCFPVKGINDPAFTFMARNKFYNAFDRLVFINLRLDLIIEIGAVKRRQKNIGVAQPEVFYNITLYFGCSCCG